MRLVATGGGTGGHIYPALEVARYAADRGAELLYLGSLRGQEGNACQVRGIAFQGFPSEPLYSLRTPRGWRAALRLLRATQMAKSALRKARPDVVFSTGGYSAAPVMAAARSLRIPYTIHEANSVPGRSNLMFARRAAAFSCVFHHTESVVQGVRVTRTGQPIRRELRDAAANRREDGQTVVVLGGSQGSVFLNELVTRAASDSRLGSAKIVLASGPYNIEATLGLVRELGLGPQFQAVPYLQTDALVEAFQSATLAIGRSGGTLAEFALFGLPSVLVPLPTAADDHQRINAVEFEEIQAATILHQPHASHSYTPSASAENLAMAVSEWLDSPERRARACQNLHQWDVPDATDRIYRLLAEAI